MMSERKASLALAPALRMMCASPMRGPNAPKSSMRASMQVTVFRCQSSVLRVGVGQQRSGSNKVKYIVGKVELIHSVDTYRLAEEINIQAKKQNVIVPILVEVNIAHEESKFGISAEDAILLVEEISKLENIRIKGLMTIAPYVENPEDNRLYFRKIKQLSVDITNKNIDNVFMEILSMGMTGDYMVAIEEGATMVRVGTGIFGERNYKQE